MTSKPITSFCASGHPFTSWVDFVARTVDHFEQDLSGLDIAPLAIGTCPDCWSTRSYPIPAGGFRAAMEAAGSQPTPRIWYCSESGEYQYSDGDEYGVVTADTSIAALCFLEHEEAMTSRQRHAVLHALGDDWAFRPIIFIGQHRPRCILRTDEHRRPSCFEPREMSDEVQEEVDAIQARAVEEVAV